MNQSTRRVLVWGRSYRPSNPQSAPTSVQRLLSTSRSTTIVTNDACRLSLKTTRHHTLSPSHHAQLWYSTSTPASAHFLAFSSGRARRRRRNKLALESAKEKRIQNGGDVAVEGLDDNEKRFGIKYRTAKEILFPEPYGPEYTKEEWQEYWACLRSPTIVMRAAREAWADYKETWEGFFEQRGLVVYTKEELEAKEREKIAAEEEKLAKEMEQQQQGQQGPTNSKSKAVQAMVERNARRNARAIKTAALMLRKQVRETTGVQSKEDLRNLAGDFMKLMSNSLKEFMEGYREGRDEETENVLKKYFTGMQDSFMAAEKEKQEKLQKKIKRRKIKRRQLSLRTGHL
mmetsp:Transcript_2763/g.7730  ORF Transcript_2763/g.7730 Transcript_2763/m.7730 type:complete len:344 (-) Transcript_2763:1129-2160(-)